MNLLREEVKCRYLSGLTMRIFLSRLSKSIFPKRSLTDRYDLINSFEKLVESNNTRVLKFFLHVSKDAQKAKTYREDRE